MDHQKSINHPLLGELVYKEKFDRWYGKIDASRTHVAINSNPDTDSNIEVIKRFIEWYSENKEFQNSKFVYELFNHDLIHGEIFIENAFDLEDKVYEKEHSILESKVEKSIRIHDINSYDNNLVVWLSTGGYTGDHAIKTTLNTKYEVVRMDM